MSLRTPAMWMATPAVLALVGTMAFTAGNDSVSFQAQGTENRDYLIPVAESATSTNPSATFTDSQGNTIATKYGHQPEWFKVASGSTAVPSAIAEAGDILYLDTFSNDTTDAGDAVMGLNVQMNVTNLPNVVDTYAACTLPVRVYNTFDNGDTWTDITWQVFAQGISEPTDPYYFNCDDGTFNFTLRGTDTMDEHYVVTLEQGGTLVPYDAASPNTKPELRFTTTPLTAPTSTVRVAASCADGFTWTGSQCTGTFTPGSSNSFTIPDGVTTVQVTMTGGSGGNGGADNGGPAVGGTGGKGGLVSGTFTVTSGDQLTFAAGSKGSNGLSNVGGTGGGAGGTNALNANYNGGRGGNAGSSGASGAGGGGGAASILLVEKTSGTYTIVAAGGGGAGGAGQTNGRSAPSSHSFYNLSATLGQNGLQPSGDGGGSGAGGGGARGGKTQPAGANDTGAYGGFRGLNTTDGLTGLTEGLASSTGNGSITITY